MSAPKRPELTDIQRDRIERAREHLAATVRDLTPGESDPGDGWAQARLYASAFGLFKADVWLLLQIIDELAGGAS